MPYNEYLCHEYNVAAHQREYNFISITLSFTYINQLSASVLTHNSFDIHDTFTSNWTHSSLKDPLEYSLELTHFA